ncbi:hypothetical protein A2634_02380 [Candidatus Amesbacteria bacterium RIFCSPHIGHO2_01_FULL_48_32]|nr:MAG: hypothetical protein A2634_02380 [Candidatus Amesbacteria bacterium RIFCSPHIGHO2_01_FULL_48_32]HJZ06273.1 hypothetical protein [Patescibacteria group bacterium]
MKIRKVVLAGAIALGVGFSIWDLNQWRHAEMDKYGQGPGGAGDELPVISYQLDRVWQNKEAGVRIRYPGEWPIKENSKFEILNPKIQVLVRFEEKIKISVEKIEGGFSDRVDEEVRNLEKVGIKMAREREYVTVETASITILTWEENGQLIQRAMTAKKDWLVIIDGYGAEEVLRAMLESLVLI